MTAEQIGVAGEFADICRLVTVPYRKGAEVTVSAGPVRVVHLGALGMPHESLATEPTLIDVHFLTVGVHDHMLDGIRERFVQALDRYPEPERLAGGPSYIEFGGQVGDQTLALRVFALGAALNLWTVITPKTLGIEGPDADNLAGGGMVMCSGYRRKKEAEATDDR